MSAWRIGVVILAVCACSRPLHTARTSPDEPAAPVELAAEQRQRQHACSPSWGLLVPGLGLLCRGHKARGLTVMALGVTELGTAIYIGEREGYDHPGSLLPLVGWQDLALYDFSDGLIERDLAYRERYAPRDSLADLLAAPVNIEILKRPDVWAGTLISVALGVAATFLFDGDDIATDNIGGDPNVFGRKFGRGVGYPLGAVTTGGLFTHVAIAEEMLFRGKLQSSLSRSQGELGGWLWSSLLFGGAHSFNALFLPEGERRDYLLYGLPFITSVGSYLGYAYRRSGYSLSVPVAIHFWYNFLLSATFFVIDPDSSPLSASISLRF